MSNLYENLQKICDQQNIKLSKLAKISGVSAGTLYDLQAGRRKTVTLPTAEKLAAALNIPVTTLTGEQKETSKDISSATKFSKHEIQLIKQYRAKPEMQNAIDKLLGI